MTQAQKQTTSPTQPDTPATSPQMQPLTADQWRQVAGGTGVGAGGTGSPVPQH